MAEWPWLVWWEFYILQCQCPYVLHISIKWHTCPIHLSYIHTYIHTYFIGSSPRGFSESILHYKIINQVHDNKNITMIKEDKAKPKLPEESSAQVDVHVDATCQGTQQLLLSSPALEMQLLENWSAECVQLFGTFLAYYVELNWGTKENAELLTSLREMLRESWR